MKQREGQPNLQQQLALQNLIMVTHVSYSQRIADFEAQSGEDKQGKREKEKKGRGEVWVEI